MKKALRIYLKNNAKVKFGQSFWERLWNSNLAQFILKKSKKDGIEQAIFQRVQSGYTKNGKLCFDYVEFVPPDFPTVLELIDDEETLNSFYASIRPQLSDEKAYLINLEEPDFKLLK